MDETVVIVAARQSQDLSIAPGLTPPDVEAIRQIYGEDYHCTVIQPIDTTQLAASIETGLIWVGFFLGCSVAIVALVAERVLTAYWQQGRTS